MNNPVKIIRTTLVVLSFFTFGVFSQTELPEECLPNPGDLPQCNFDKTFNVCGFQSVSSDFLEGSTTERFGWKKKLSDKFDVSSIPTDKSGTGGFAALDVTNSKAKFNSTARLRTSTFNATSTKAICLNFDYASTTYDNMSPTLNVIIRTPVPGKNEKVMATLNETTKGDWVHHSFQFCIRESARVILESSKVSRGSLVGIDNFMITPSTKICPGRATIAPLTTDTLSNSTTVEQDTSTVAPNTTDETSVLPSNETTETILSPTNETSTISPQDTTNQTSSQTASDSTMGTTNSTTTESEPDMNFTVYNYSSTGSNLSQGGKIAIGVVCSLSVIAICFVIFVIYRKKKSKSHVEISLHDRTKY